MTDPVLPPRTAARRRRHRRNVVAGAITGVLLLVLIVGGVLVATDVVRIGAQSSPRLARAAAATTTTIAAEEQDPSGCREPLTPTAPLRLWIGGDSLAGSLGPSLGAMTAETGVVQPQFDSRVSSGLVNTSFFDWPKQAAAEMDSLDPEVVAYIIGANDTGIVGERTAPGRPTWQQEYAALTEQMMRVLIGNGRQVYWFGPPVMKEAKYDEKVAQLTEVAREVARRFPQVTWIDSRTLLADTDGTYTAYKADADGRTVLVRAGDGVHLTPEGGDVLAQAAFEKLDAECDLTGQAVPDQPKTVRETRGSNQVPGTRRQTIGGVSTTTYRSTTTTTRAQTTTTSTPTIDPVTTTSPPPPPPPPSTSTTAPGGPTVGNGNGNGNPNKP